MDATRLALAAAGLVLVLVADRLVGDSLVDVVADLFSGFETLDPEAVTVVAALARLALAAALAWGLVLALRGGHGAFLLTAAAGAAGGALLLVLLDGLLDASAPALVPTTADLGALGGSGFPTGAGLAAVTGAVAAGVPWLDRRHRRIGWTLVLVLALLRLLTAPLSFETVTALLCGALAGALADAALGVPTRRPTQAAVVAGLERVGVHLSELHPASVDARGSTPYFGTTSDGTPVFVKALGADERKADLLFRVVRSVNPRQLGDERPFSSLRRAVEHEALVALAAAGMGIRTPRLAALATAEPGAFVLAYERVEGRSLDGVEPAELGDDVLDDLWGQMRLLRTAGVAHRDLRLANVFLAADGSVWMIDFGFSELAASELLLANDLAELVTAVALAVGADRSVERAVAGVGKAPLVAALPRFEPGYLSGATRTALKQRPGLLDDVRAAITGAAEP